MNDDPAPFLVKRDQAGRWWVKQGRQWRQADDLVVQVTIATVTEKGEGLVLGGVGVVRCLQRGAIVITA